MSESLGQAIVLYRTVARMHRKELAATAGLSYPYVSELENGLKEPSLAALTKIADVLQVAPSQLLATAEKLERGEPVLF